MSWRHHIPREIDRLASVCEGVDPATPVPTCDGWTIADLLEHVGTVYRWAATMVRDRAQERLPREQMDWATPASPDGWAAWLRDGTSFLLETFEAADPAAPTWAWGWPKTAGFWPRRMVHEIGVHRADAELALGIRPTFDPEVAADGVDELLDNIPHAEYFAPAVARLRGDGETIALRAGAAAWTIRLRPDRFEWAREGGGADAVVTAPTAGDLLLAMYGRPAAVEVGGDASLWTRWRAHSAI